MAKYGIVFDSSCNLTNKQAEKKGVFVIPIIIKLNEKTYKAGYDITTSDLYEKMVKGSTTISTSTPIAKDIERVLDLALTKHKEVIFIGMSQFLTSTVNIVRVVVDSNKKFKGKVHIYDSYICSPWIYLYLEEMINKVNKIKKPEELYLLLDETSAYNQGWLMPGDFWWFYKGGRITRTQYLVGNIARINGVLQMDGGKFKEEVLKGLTIKSTVKKIHAKLQSRLDELTEQKIEWKLVNLYAGSRERTDEIKKYVMEIFELEESDIIETWISPEQVSHMGPGSVGISYKVMSLKEK